MLATYSGTKAFLATFTSALAEEVRSHGIVVQHLNTYFVVRNILSESLHLTTSLLLSSSRFPRCPTSDAHLHSFRPPDHTCAHASPKLGCQVVQHSLIAQARSRRSGATLSSIMQCMSSDGRAGLSCIPIPCTRISGKGHSGSWRGKPRRSRSLPQIVRMS
jgi:hypothetical protein